MNPARFKLGVCTTCGSSSGGTGRGGASSLPLITHTIRPDKNLSPPPSKSQPPQVLPTAPCLPKSPPCLWSDHDWPFCGQCVFLPTQNMLLHLPPLGRRAFLCYRTSHLWLHMGNFLLSVASLCRNCIIIQPVTLLLVLPSLDPTLNKVFSFLFTWPKFWKQLLLQFGIVTPNEKHFLWDLDYVTGLFHSDLN